MDALTATKTTIICNLTGVLCTPVFFQPAICEALTAVNPSRMSERTDSILNTAGACDALTLVIRSN